MNEEKNQRALAVIIVIAVIGLGVYKLFFAKNNKNYIDTSIKIVEDINEFYTVSSCVDKYFLYSNESDTENILILLSKEYKEKNNIDSNNLYSHIGKFDDYYSFVPKKMYVQQIDKHKYKYYVYGLKQTELEGEVFLYNTVSDYYIIVILDKSNITFAIEPYDGESFSKIDV